MSEAILDNDDDTPDALSLSALLSSRVCHDLINPVGAIGSGLDVLDDPDTEPPMRDAALDLVRSGAHKAIALLSYARLAYGAAGGFGAEISLEDAEKALKGVFDLVKPELDWRIGAGFSPKEHVKTLLILGYAAADCVPRGGAVVVEGTPEKFEIRASGPKMYLQDELRQALSGDARDLAPKFTPALIASELVAAAGGTISAEIADDCVTLKAAFSA